MKLHTLTTGTGHTSAHTSCIPRESVTPISRILVGLARVAVASARGSVLRSPAFSVGSPHLVFVRRSFWRTAAVSVSVASVVRNCSNTNGRGMGQKGSKDRLSKGDLEFLKTSTRYDENTIKEWYRGFRSDCPDGKLTPTAFMQIYSKCFPTGNANEFCDHVFRTFDTDKNGYIDFKEFLLAIDVTSSGCPEEKLNWAFSMYDVDGNGFIDLAEMTRIVKSIYNMMGPNQMAMGDGYENPEARAEGIFRRMDVNADGKITRKEFVRCCLEDKKLIQLLTPHAP